jgi:DNA-binding transcriptional LysR family regulator
MATDLRTLRYFIAVAEEGHVTRAAERLGMQQPPLSQQIKALERRLDVQLFRRKPRGVELTDAGRALLEEARAILAHLDRAFETTQRTARGEQGRIRVGVTPTSMYHPFVPQVIRAFREAFPLVFLTLEEGRSSELIEHLRDERIDVGFIRMPPADPGGLLVSSLLEEPMVAALPIGHPLAQGDPKSAIALKSLGNETFITYARRDGLGLHEAAFSAYQAAGFTPRIGQEGPRITSMLNLVAVGLGISFVPASLQRMHMDGVAYRPINSRPQLTAPLSIASRRSAPSAAVRHFLNLVKKAAKSLP